MKNPLRKLMPVLAMLALGSLGVPKASAACANPFTKANLSQLRNGQVGLAPNLLMVDGEGPTMVGLWHVAFIAEGNTAPGLPPDGTQVDSTLSIWHPDHTEETLSSRPPATGDVCFGVWKQVGERHYQLNHFGIAFNPAVDPNTPRGFDNIHQDIILSRDGKTFIGSFSVDQYDSKGNLMDEIKGNLVGTRITLSTTVADLVS